jgi:cell division septation protein DedD
MKHAADYISLLLYTHECVVLPGMGGFVTRNVPARIDRKTNVAYPPGKEVFFNRNLQRNDGLLAHEICLHEGVGFNEAMARLRLWVNDLQQQLELRGMAELPGMGNFYRGDGGQVQFSFTAVPRFLDVAYGLPVLRLSAHVSKSGVTAEPEKTGVETPVIPIGSVVTEETPVRNRKTARWVRAAAAAAIFIPIGFYAWWIPSQTQVLNTGKLTAADLNPFKSQEMPVATYHIRASNMSLSGDMEPIEVKTPVAGEYLTLETDRETLVLLVESAKDLQTDEISGPYFAMIGAFSNPDNARRMIESLREKGHRAFVVDTTNGLLRIAVAQYTDEVEASKGLRDIQSADFPEAWLLKK